MCKNKFAFLPKKGFFYTTLILLTMNTLRPLCCIFMLCLLGCSPKEKKPKFEYKRTKQAPLQKPPAAKTVQLTDLTNKGIGPVTSFVPDEINSNWVAMGAEIFKSKCTACHKMGRKFIGPNLTNIQERRSPEWVLNMILNPEEMLEKDPIAKQLLIEANGAPMANQNISLEEAKYLYDYFRSF